MADILDYMNVVENDLKNGVRGAQMRNLILPLKMLLPMHSDKLAETDILENFNESIKGYIALYETDDQMESSEDPDQSSVLIILKEILNIEYAKETVCSGPDKNMSPHKADPQIFADHGMCAKCLLTSGAFVNVNSIGGNKKSRKPKEKSDILLNNIVKCMDEVLDEEEKGELKKCLKEEDQISGNELFQKLKAVRMSKTEGNWSLLKNQIDRDTAKLSSAFGVHAVVYMYHERQKKILKLGMESRKRCKKIGTRTSENGQVLNTFTLAENHLTNVLQNVRGDPLPSKMQACLAAKVLNALGSVGIRKLSAEKIAIGFKNTEAFSSKFESWMDQLEISGESALAVDEEESDAEEYEDESNRQGLSREENSSRQNENGDDILENEAVDSPSIIQEQLFASSPGGSIIQMNDDQFENAPILLEDGHLIDRKERAVDGFKVLVSRVDGVQRLDEMKPGPIAELQYVDDGDVSLMKSFTKQNKQAKKRKIN